VTLLLGVQISAAVVVFWSLGFQRGHTSSGYGPNSAILGITTLIRDIIGTFPVRHWQVPGNRRPYPFPGTGAKAEHDFTVLIVERRGFESRSLLPP
jgi:hypothetical protein